MTVHTAGDGSPWLGHRTMLCEPAPDAKVLPPGQGAVGGDRDWEAASRLQALEKGVKLK